MTLKFFGGGIEKNQEYVLKKLESLIMSGYRELKGLYLDLELQQSEKNRKELLEKLDKEISNGYSNLYLKEKSFTNKLQEYHLAEKLYHEAVAEEKNGNKEKAFALYSEAAKKEYAPAQSAVAICYEIGQGVLSDMQKSREWHIKAANNGDRYSQMCLGNLSIQEERDIVKGLYWLEKSALAGEKGAFRCLGKLYENGEFVEKNMTKAKEYYLQAVKLGDKWSENKLKSF